MASYNLWGSVVESSKPDSDAFAEMLRGNDRNFRILSMDHSVLAQAIRNSAFAWNLAMNSSNIASDPESGLNAAQIQRDALLTAVRPLSPPAQMRVLHVWQITTLPPWLRRAASGFASVAFVPSPGTVQETRRGRMAPYSGVSVVVVHPRVERFGVRSRVCFDYKAYGCDQDPETGIVMIGGGHRNKCAFRLSSPTRANPQGSVMGYGETRSMWLGLSLHWNLIQAALGKPVRPVKLPRFWLTFAPQAEIQPEVTRSLELEACYRLTAASYANLPVPGFQALPSLRSPGGTITAIRSGDERITVELGSDVVELPANAHLKPWTTVGNEVPHGAALADYVPRGCYVEWQDVIGIVGEDVARRILKDVWAGMSFSARGVNYVPLDFFEPYSAQRPVWQSLQSLMRLPDLGEIRGPLPRGRRAVAPRLASSLTWQLGDDVRGSLQLAGPACTADLHSVRQCWKHAFE